MRTPSKEEIINDAVSQCATVGQVNDFIKMIEYKEELNKEIATARDYNNVNKHMHIDTLQLMRTDKQHIIEVLMHAMATIRHLENGKNRSTK